jgi:hypothetical protein
MSGFDDNGFYKPGTIGRGTHLGDPLTAEQIRNLSDATEIVVTWCGGNGPWPYRVLVDFSGDRRAEVLDTPLLIEDWHAKPLNRITIGWDDQTRTWANGKIREPQHIRDEWTRLRGRKPSGEPVYLS